MIAPSFAPPPAAFVHVDLDGLWTLAGCYGFDEGDLFARDPVFELALPRMERMLDELGLRGTFFIVGRDLESAEKARAIAALAAAGHELANHTHSHRLDLEDADAGVLAREIADTSDALERLTGRRPAGFRAPGYTAGPRMLEVCARAGLRYDGSRLPTPWGPVLRFLAGRLRARVRAGGQPPAPPAGRQYGGGGTDRIQWFYPAGGGAPLPRFPLAVSPLLRLPLHASFGALMGERAVVAGLRRLARRGGPITYLLHGMDFLGGGDLAGRLPEGLLRTRAFAAPLEDKLAFARAVLGELKSLTRVQRTVDWLETEGPCP